MADPALLALEAAPPQKGSKYVPLTTQIFFSGLVTNRTPNGSLDNRYYRKFLGGRPDQLIDGSNVELSVYGSLTRRFGTTEFSNFNFGLAASNLYSYYSAPGVINMVGSFGDKIYSAINTSPVSIFTATGASTLPAFFLAVGTQLYWSNGTDLKGFNAALSVTSSNPRKWGITAPTVTPTFTIVPSGAFWQPTHAFGLGAGIWDSNGNGETSSGGTSGGTAPVWNTSFSGTTTDGSITWTNTGPFPTLLFEYTGVQYVYSYRNSSSGAISTASPPSVNTGPQVGVAIDVSGAYSTDPQVDLVRIYRTEDGGEFFDFLADIANNTAGGTWTYTDDTPDSGLNTFITAPLDHENDPPPAGFNYPIYYLGRVWGAVANFVYFSAGPDVTDGNGNEAFPPANVLEFPANVTRIVPTSYGLLVFTVDAIYIILGNTTSSFYYLPYQQGIGLSNYFCLDIQGQNIYLYTSDQRVLQLSAAGILDVGFPIINTLSQTYFTVNSYVSALSNGTSDNAVFVGSSVQGKWYRLNPNQVPEGGPAWSPEATLLSSGYGFLGQIEVAPGLFRLIISSNDGTLLERTVGQFTDFVPGSGPLTFSAYATVGSLVLAQPGQIAEVKSITLESRFNTLPFGVATLLNGTSFGNGIYAGTFTPLPVSVNSPPQLNPVTGFMSLEYYLKQSMVAATNACRQMFAKITWPTESNVNELMTFSVYGLLDTKE